jgi:hypothetical protein
MVHPKTFIHYGFCQGCKINTHWDFIYGVITMQPISYSRLMPLLFQQLDQLLEWNSITSVGWLGILLALTLILCDVYFMGVLS